MSDLPAAPPPYELSSPQELDRKVDAALEESIAHLSNSGEEEVWENWDEAAFQAAQASLHDHSALPSAQPLRINKKLKVPSPSVSSKDRPSWFEEAGLGGSSSSSTYRHDARPSPLIRTSVTNPSSSSGFTSQTSHRVSLQLAPGEEEDRSIAPPPFTAVGPSLDGPPFEEIDSTTYVNNAHAYASPPPSPLVSPTASHPPRPLLLYPIPSTSPLQPEPRRTPPRQSLPAPTRPYIRLSPRPASSTGNTTPIVGFDPSVAYTNPGLSLNPRGDEVASFYNPAVTAHLANGPSRPSLANAVTYPSQRFRASARGFSNSTPFNNDDDWARNLYDQYSLHPTNPPPVPPVASEQPQQYQHHSDPRLRPTSLQGQWRSR